MSRMHLRTSPELQAQGPLLLVHLQCVLTVLPVFLLHGAPLVHQLLQRWTGSHMVKQTKQKYGQDDMLMQQGMSNRSDREMCLSLCGLIKIKPKDKN